jgi:uncharacterized membrane protein
MEGPAVSPETPAAPEPSQSEAGDPGRSNFRRFFIRGLAIVLPTVLTIGVLLWAARLVDQTIAAPINAGIREVVVRFTDFPPAEEGDFVDAFAKLEQEKRSAFNDFRAYAAERAEDYGRENFTDLADALERRIEMEWMRSRPENLLLARREAFEKRWNQYTLGTWPVFNLIGLLLAIVLVYIVGAFLSRSIGNRLWRIGENAISRVPLVGRVYPAFKQITDFVFGDDSEDKLKFNRVVAVQYPRKGLWSVGLVTGNTMRTIQDQAGVHCLTVFIPSSPTPFTGYVITVPIDETVDLPVTIEDALKFAVSGGVVVPPRQVIAEAYTFPPGPSSPETLQEAISSKTPR